MRQRSAFDNVAMRAGTRYLQITHTCVLLFIALTCAASPTSRNSLELISAFSNDASTRRVHGPFADDTSFPVLDSKTRKTSVTSFNLTLDTCFSSDRCAEGRACKLPAGASSGSDCYEKPCLCKPRTFTPCTARTDCVNGEICLGIGISPFVCASTDALNYHIVSTVEDFKNGAADFPTSCPSNVFQVRRTSQNFPLAQHDFTLQGMPESSPASVSTGDACTVDDNDSCPVGNFICLNGSTTPLLHSRERNVSFTCCTKDSDQCRCHRLNPPLCEDSSDCAANESCVEIEHVPPLCVSSEFLESLPPSSYSIVETPTFSPEDSDSDICVDVKVLESISVHRFVFPEHRRARVLCDQHMLCATPGHVIVFKRTPMTMKTYCTLVTCRPRTAWVNSPSYVPGWRRRVHSPHVELTPLAAKYESALEETVLRLLVRIGFWLSTISECIPYSVYSGLVRHCRSRNIAFCAHVSWNLQSSSWFLFRSGGFYNINLSDVFNLNPAPTPLWRKEKHVEITEFGRHRKEKMLSQGTLCFKLWGKTKLRGPLHLVTHSPPFRNRSPVFQRWTKRCPRPRVWNRSVFVTENNGDNQVYVGRKSLVVPFQIDDAVDTSPITSKCRCRWLL